jgi:hypothetical protein
MFSIFSLHACDSHTVNLLREIANRGLMTHLSVSVFSVYGGLEPPHVFADPHDPALEVLG